MREPIEIVAKSEPGAPGSGSDDREPIEIAGESDPDADALCMRARARTISVPEAGRWLGLGRNAAYDAARRGEIPVLRFGKRIRVSVVALERMLAR
jgi:excisionase family DNA binding protein